MGDEKRTKTTKNLSMNLLTKSLLKESKKYNFPTLFGFPNGHIFDNRPLIIGSKVKMEVEEKGLVKIL
jgi:muramoyltetrapeptide carboxypeptidase